MGGLTTVDKRLSKKEKKSIRDRLYYLKNLGRVRAKTRQYAITHRDYYKEYYANYYQKRKHELNSKNKEWAKRNPHRIKQIKLKHATINREMLNRAHRERVRQWRLKLFDILGGRQCVQCGYNTDVRALAFDHIRDDGIEDRKTHCLTAYGFYRFYVKNPDIARANLQVLCCNCNNIKKYDLMGYKLI